MFPTTVSFVVTGSTEADTIVYVPIPVRCTIKSAQAACSADPGDAETIILADGSNTVGTLTFGSSIADGATGTYAADATYGDTVFDPGDSVKLTVSTLTAAAVFTGYIVLDEFARTEQ